MGMTIFTSSGTFTPSNYGLKAGDCIHIICVGGGGGGYGYGSAGKAGSASSFGSIVSSAGGNAGVSGWNTFPAVQNGSCQASCSTSTSMLPYGNSTYSVYAGGSGGHGWHPKLITPIIAGNVTSHLSLTLGGGNSNYPLQAYPSIGTGPVIANIAGSLAPFGYQSSQPCQNSAQTGLFGGYGGTWYHSGALFLIGGPGGVGYGAGGGGNVSTSGGQYGGSGGNGGVVNHIDYVLTSTSGIAVTVGNGGAGGAFASGTNGGGGGGARGCVAIFW